MWIEIPERLQTARAPRNVKTPWLTGRGTRWMVSRDWVVVIDGERYTIPAGYVFNGSSIPWFLWWLFPPTYAPAWEASCFHDLCYSHLWRQVTKRFADDAFRAIMLQQGANSAVAAVFYQAVHRFGKGGW